MLTKTIGLGLYLPTAVSTVEGFSSVGFEECSLTVWVRSHRSRQHHSDHWKKLRLTRCYLLACVAAVAK